MWKLEAIERTVSVPVITDIISLYPAVVLAGTFKKHRYILFQIWFGEIAS